MFRKPIDFLLIGFQKARLDFLDIDKPGRNRVIEKRSAAAPAVRIRVLVHFALKQEPLNFQLVFDGFFCVLVNQQFYTLRRFF